MAEAPNDRTKYKDNYIRERRDFGYSETIRLFTGLFLVGYVLKRERGGCAKSTNGIPKFTGSESIDFPSLFTSLRYDDNVSHIKLGEDNTYYIIRTNFYD